MQSMQWKHSGSPLPKKLKRVSSAKKVMASVFWDSQGVIMSEYLEQGRTINGTYEAFAPGNCKQDERKIDLRCSALQDNAPAHTSQVAMTAATECGFEVLTHPPYSPDMVPSDFYLSQN